MILEFRVLFSWGGGTAKKGQKWYFEVGGGILTTRKEKCKHLNFKQFLGIDFCPKRSNLLSSIADVIIHLVTFYFSLRSVEQGTCRSFAGTVHLGQD